MKQTLNYVAGLKEGLKCLEDDFAINNGVNSFVCCCVNDKENKEGVSIELKCWTKRKREWRK